MQLKIFPFLIFIFISFSSFAVNEASQDPRKKIRLQSSITLVPAGVFVTKSGFENSTFNKTNDQTGFGIGFTQNVMFRFHPHFGIGLSGSFILFLEKAEFTRAVDQHLNLVTGGTPLPILIEITVPVKTYFTLVKNLELQAFLEAGVALLRMPKALTLGVGPLLTPGIGLEYNFSKSSSKALSAHLDLAYSFSWISLEDERKIGAITPTYISSIPFMHYLQVRLGLSYNL